jgi:hypothetical protein
MMNAIDGDIASPSTEPKEESSVKTNNSKIKFIQKCRVIFFYRDKK